MRLFIALGIPHPLSARLAELRGSLAEVNWVPPETYHLTLRFIGEVTDRHLMEDIHHALSAIRAPSFDLLADGPGLFERPAAPATLWMGVVRNESLLHLQRKVDTAMRRVGLDDRRRRFVPHITLGSIPHPDPARLAPWLGRHGLADGAATTIEAFSLYSSLRGKESPVYEVLEDYTLSP
ncbi:RNA 2',3'-cyclic phosphodiesterase [Gluconacetobacter entanii]|uniref:RNA 2',3'-cyclic phosphodiesterase n=1 Tax=Gluconacetobacter entanii TaxID=108528 RepID=A0A318PTB6_9PROT|nr:RNA 2',3'-cyclic phosphodiesterase [Gluconacetobacter entanii]MCE2579948.1 RNA 2',3'-cyclic phosphodiesterase [Komagataeibacter sp. FNDCR1]MBY4639375.1 RNA 2',3'-cyclic phosphodiesterase [Gluconacetobacter entanii]MCW4582149.1 RNA 2',3'-cyclic phosphodiesterase [Gluconacetobacter entanii]MCW4585492.1 RNA 2',3'-cyclic phosphodiesterase [Gluconacetobacter entanii]MCW4588547.1 RNA 2',3'-cyclic phosphodiesterase [Gluconacetobacter entanii]